MAEVLDVVQALVGTGFATKQTHEDILGMLPALAAMSAFGPQTFQWHGNTVCRNDASGQSSTCPTYGHQTLQLTQSGGIDADGAVGSGWKIGLETVGSWTEDVKREQGSKPESQCTVSLFPAVWVPTWLWMAFCPLEESI